MFLSLEPPPPPPGNELAWRTKAAQAPAGSPIPLQGLVGEGQAKGVGGICPKRLGMWEGARGRIPGLGGTGTMGARDRASPPAPTDGGGRGLRPRLCSTFGFGEQSSRAWTLQPAHGHQAGLSCCSLWGGGCYTPHLDSQAHFSLPASSCSLLTSVMSSPWGSLGAQSCPTAQTKAQDPGYSCLEWNQPEPGSDHAETQGSPAQPDPAPWEVPITETEIPA